MLRVHNAVAHERSKLDSLKCHRADGMCMHDGYALAHEDVAQQRQQHHACWHDASIIDGSKRQIVHLEAACEPAHTDTRAILMRHHDGLVALPQEALCECQNMALDAARRWIEEVTDQYRDVAGRAASATPRRAPREPSFQQAERPPAVVVP